MTVQRFTARHIYGDDVSPAEDGEYVLWEEYDVLQRENAALKETQEAALLELRMLRRESK